MVARTFRKSASGLALRNQLTQTSMRLSNQRNLTEPQTRRFSSEVTVAFIGRLMSMPFRLRQGGPSLTTILVLLSFTAELVMPPADASSVARKTTVHFAI